MGIDISLGGGASDLIAAASGVGGALIGGLIGGLFTLAGVSKQQDGERRRRHEDETASLDATLKALDTEMETLWSAYMAKVGCHVDEIPEGRSWLDGWAAATDYFVVYRSAGPQLGKIRDDDLRRAIVVAFTLAMGLLESHVTYRELVNQAWQAELEPERQRTTMPDPWHMVDLAFPQLRDHQAEVAEAIVEMHRQIQRATRQSA